jgi:broad specificity phosphatase PhoE
MGVTIVFETHSTSSDNEAGVATGWLPGELSERGRVQALELRARRSEDHVDAVFVSDLRRAVDVVFPGGESWRDAVRRVRGSLDDIAAAYPGRRVVVIGHVATRWALDHFVHGTPLEVLAAGPFEWREGWEYLYAASS